MPRLEQKTALVTGGAQGIGEAIARAFAAEGATVWLTDTNHAAGEALASALGKSVRFAALDVSAEDAWARVMSEITEAGQSLDVLVNNAGITGLEQGATHDPEHASLEEWHRVLRVNLDGVFLGCRVGIRAMAPQGRGSIINIASRAGSVGVPLAAAYAASKAAIRNHTRTVALYCASKGLEIRCNSISPAAVLTPIWEPLLGDGPDRKEKVRSFVSTAAVKRFGDPSEVASLAVLLASDEATYMTGEDLALDGGLGAGSAEVP